jgi:hypothetical protein
MLFLCSGMILTVAIVCFVQSPFSFLLHYFRHYTRSKQFNLQLPSEVDEYDAIKEKCLSAGFEPGKVR